MPLSLDSIIDRLTDEETVELALAALSDLPNDVAVTLVKDWIREQGLAEEKACRGVMPTIYPRPSEFGHASSCPKWWSPDARRADGTIIANEPCNCWRAPLRQAIELARQLVVLLEEPAPGAVACRALVEEIRALLG